MIFVILVVKVVLVASDLEVAWLAGLIEGEGCFTLHSEKRHPYFLMDMTDQDVLEKAATLFPNLFTLRGPYTNKNKSQHKPRYRVDAFGPKCRELMMLVYPHMGARRRLKIDELRALN